MKQHEFSRTLRLMETLAERSYEADPAEKRRLDAEYRQLAELIEPYSRGTLQLQADTPEEAAAERAAWAAAQ